MSSFPRRVVNQKDLHFFVLIGGEIWWTTQHNVDPDRPLQSYLGKVSILFMGGNLMSYKQEDFMRIYQASLPYTNDLEWAEFFEVYPMFVRSLQFEFSGELENPTHNF